MVMHGATSTHSHYTQPTVATPTQSRYSTQTYYPTPQLPTNLVAAIPQLHSHYNWQLLHQQHKTRVSHILVITLSIPRIYHCTSYI